MIKMDKNTINSRMKSMPKGFRFFPTEEELLTHYLKLKMDGRDSEVEHVISEVEICRYDPWDLPCKSAVESNDKEWFFFSPCNYKYKESKRFKRTTDRGYWKPTGKDRKVKVQGKVIGIKKNLGYYTGRYPDGQCTNWVIHEYHSLQTFPGQKAFVLCRLKKNPGETLDKGGTSSEIVSNRGNYEAETATPKVQHQLEEDLRALITPVSPSERNLTLPFLPSPQDNERESYIQELHCADGNTSDCNRSQSLMGEDEEDIMKYLNPDAFGQAEGSEVTLTRSDPVKDAFILKKHVYSAEDNGICLVEVNPSACGHDHLREGHEYFLPTEFEESDGSSDDSSTDTPRIKWLHLQGNLAPISSEDKKAIEADTNEVLKGKLKLSSYKSSGRDHKAPLVVFDKPLLRQKCKPPAVYFLNCIVCFALLILYLRVEVLG